jgi:hypothetical protein
VRDVLQRELDAVLLPGEPFAKAPGDAQHLGLHAHFELTLERRDGVALALGLQQVAA